MATYDTMDKLRRIANDPTAASAEREFARAKLREYARQPVVYNNQKSNWGIRVAERTATVVAEEQDKRDAIAARAEDRARNAVEAQHQHEIRIEKARVDHATYMAKAQNDLEEAQCHLEEQRALRAERLTKVRARAH
jgi:hypothetical protein